MLVSVLALKSLQGSIHQSCLLGIERERSATAIPWNIFVSDPRLLECKTLFWSWILRVLTNLLLARIENIPHGLPWWLSGEEYACQWRSHRFDPWSRKVPHAVKQLSPCTTTTQHYWTCVLQPRRCDYGSLCALESVLCNKKSHHNEKPVHCN